MTTLQISQTDRVLVVSMPLLEISALCLLPEFRRILSRFPQQIKVQFLATPAQLFLNPSVAPFIVETGSRAPVLDRLRKTLETHTHDH